MKLAGKIRYKGNPVPLVNAVHHLSAIPYHIRYEPILRIKPEEVTWWR